MQAQLCSDWYGPLPPGVWLAEPKIDGVRALVTVAADGSVSVASREGLPLTGCGSILTEVAALHLAPCTLDGELYAGSFEQTLSVINGGFGNPIFHVFDLIQTTAFPLMERRRVLIASMRHASPLTTPRHISPHIRLVQSCLVHSDADAQAAMQQYVREGFEGVVLKLDSSTYSQPGSWIRRKPFHDCDLRAVTAIEGKGKFVRTCGALIVEGPVSWRGEIRTVRTKIGNGFDDDTRRMLWAAHQAGQLAGLVVEVSFQEVTDAGALRFATFRRMRPDKS